MAQPYHSVKVMLIGAGNTGKTHILHRIIGKYPPENTQTYVDSNYQKKMNTMGTECAVNLDIRDTVGQQHVREVVLREAIDYDTIVITSDVTRKTWESDIRFYLTELSRQKVKHPRKIIVALTKLDELRMEEESTSSSSSSDSHDKRKKSPKRSLVYKDEDTAKKVEKLENLVQTQYGFELFKVSAKENTNIKFLVDAIVKDTAVWPSAKNSCGCIIQ